MQLGELLQQAGLEDGRESPVEISAITFDSRRTVPGACFVAVRGSACDGHEFIPQAVRAGCAAIVCEDPAGVASGTPCAVVADTQEALGRLAQAFYGWPARKLVNIGITGTNGKTTVAHLVNAALAAGGYRPALLGTIRYQTGVRDVEAGTTTPDPVMLAEMMAEMVRAGKTHLVMEVSSHALDQRRSAGVDFRVGVFTNLSGDHLDYHGTMERYTAAKRRLFESLGSQADAVISFDDPPGREMALATAAAVTWYGLDDGADVHGRIDALDARGARFRIARGAEEATVRSLLIGEHNVLNSLAAAGTCLVLGMDLPAIATALETTRTPPGRLERVGGDTPYEVFVDYAHTDDALANVLSSLRKVTRGRLIVVFGCGGDRDRSKRPRMGRVAAELADHAIITSDNPRSEKPGAIIDEILAGLAGAARAACEVEPDRRKAIALAIDIAEEDDIVLLAGKGHETCQEIRGRRTVFNDVSVARELIERRKRNE